MKSTRQIFAALLIGGMVAAPAHAALTAGSVNCAAGGTLATMSALDCTGSWTGSDTTQQADVLAQLGADFTDVTGLATWSLVGTTLAGSSVGPFQNVPNTDSGVLNFDSPVAGYFAVALKTSNNRFSLYLFDGGVAGLSQIDFTTLGVTTPAPERSTLAHASLYTAQPVPEPETYLMLLAGLGLVGYAARRKAR